MDTRRGINIFEDAATNECYFIFYNNKFFSVILFHMLKGNPLTGKPSSPCSPFSPGRPGIPSLPGSPGRPTLPGSPRDP